MGRRLRPEDEHEHETPEPAAEAAPAPHAASPANILALQRSCGNAAVGRMLAARRELTGKGAPATEDEEQMVEVTGDPETTTAPAPTPLGGGTPPAGSTPKLTKKNVGGAAKGLKNGAFKWVVQWELDKPTTTGGWVVQKVEVDRDVKDKDDKPIDASKGGLNPSWYPLWEAWQINKDQKVTTYAETGDTEDDTYGQGAIKDSKGSVAVRGAPEFYEGLTLPGSFKVTNKAPTWILPATNSAPTLTGGTGVIAHDLTATWDGITGDGKTKVSTK